MSTLPSSSCEWGMTGRVVDGRVEFVCATCQHIAITGAKDFELAVPCPRATSVALANVFGTGAKAKAIT